MFDAAAAAAADDDDDADDDATGSLAVNHQFHHTCLPVVSLCHCHSGQ